jgi:hypothetical protein
MRNTLILATALLLASCSEYQAAFKGVENQAVQATQNVNDDAADIWAKTGCGLTYGAAVRNPAVGRVLPFLCGRMPDGSELPAPSLAPVAR